MCYIVTGGCGFIGSNFVNMLTDTTDSTVIVLDNMTYAADTNNINDHKRVRVIETDISQDTGVLSDLLVHNNVLGIFHFAAESHVDNSITGPRIFVDTNL